MASTAYKINDRRGLNLGWSSTNVLFDGATTNRARTAIASNDKDTRINLSEIGFRELLSASRYIFSNYGPVRNAILEQAKLTVGQSFIPQFKGKDVKWGNRAEEALWNWHKICDVRGEPYDFAVDLYLSIVAVKRDCDVVILQTEREDGYPQIQPIPSHRIGSRNFERVVGPSVFGMEFEGSDRFVGKQICNGVISNDFSRTIGFRLCDDRGNPQRDEYAENIIHGYFPDWFDQARGITPLAAGINDCHDLKEIHDFLKLAIKAESAIAYKEFNETGGVSTGKAFLSANSATAPSAAPYFESLEGGQIRYFKAKSGSNIEVLSSDRPARNTQDFMLGIMRSAFHALEWPLGISYNPEVLGGANSRMVVAMAKRTIEHNQGMLLKIARRIDAWAVAKFIKLGLLEPNPEWWMWEHQTPPHITTDAGYDSQIQIDEYKMGFSTLRDVCGKRGKWWEEERDQCEREALDLIGRAQKLSKETGAPFELCINLLQQRNPNPQLQAQQATEKPGENNQ